MPLNINGTTGISGVDGSVSAPAVTGTDSNTGITFPSADTIKFATGGVERMAITNSGISGITAGITMAQQWRVTSDFTVSSGSDSAITSNWESADTHGYGTIGSNLTESSGVFSFPSTGIYRIGAKTTFNNTSSANYKTELKMQVKTASNSNWEMATGSGQSLSSPAEQTGSMSLEYLFDVTNTSSCVFRLLVFSHQDSIKFHGASDKTETGFTVIRLGDT